MTTTPETPALPGDLTDAAMKLAALTLGLPVSGSPNRTDLAHRVLRLGIAAAGVAPAPDNGLCGGCRDLGPHRNVPGCDYYEPEPAPVTSSESDWLLLLMPDSGAHRTREWRGRAVDSDSAIERAMDENPGWSVHTFGPDVNAEPVPSPEREKLRVEASNRIADIVFDQVKRCWPDLHPVFGLRYGIADAVIAEFPALAVPPVVNNRNAQMIAEARLRWPGDSAELRWSSRDVRDAFLLGIEMGDAYAQKPNIDKVALATLIREELLTDDAVAEGWSAPKVDATALRVRDSIVDQRSKWIGGLK